MSSIDSGAGRERGPLLAAGRTAEVFAWGDGEVLKLLRPGFPPELADLEARLVAAVRATGFAVPAVRAVVEVNGRRGVVFDRVDGPSMWQEILRRPWTARRWARGLAELHADMHGRSLEGVPLADLPPLLPRLRRRIEEGPLPGPVKRAALRATENLADGDAICHLDFHPGNVFLTPKGPVIIDWLDAARGPPLADVARTALLIDVARPPKGMGGRHLMGWLRRPFQSYVRRYGEMRPHPPDALAAWRIPIAAARADEGIADERRRLRRILERAL